MPINFPVSLDTLPTIASTDLEDDAGIEHDIVHTDLAEAVMALQVKLGIDDDTDAASMDYRVQRLEGIVGAIIDNLGPTAVSVTGAFTDPGYVGDPLSGSLTISNGWSPYSVAVQSGAAPPGTSFGITGSTVTSTGNCTTAGAYTWTLRVRGADGSYDDSAQSLDIYTGGYAYWNPADKVNCTISGADDEIATCATPGSTAWVRSVTSHNSGAFQVEFEIVDTSAAIGVGFALTGAISGYVGGDTLSWAVWSESGSLNLYYNGSVVDSTAGALVDGSRVALRLDIDAGTAEFDLDGVSTGLTVSFTPNITLFLACDMYSGGEIQLITDPADLEGAPVGGYTDGWPT